MRKQQHEFVDHYDTCVECRVPALNPNGVAKDKPFDGCEAGRKLFQSWREDRQL